MAEPGLAKFANDLITRRGLSRVAVITSNTTGNPTLQALDLRRPRLVVAVKYDGEHGETPADVDELLQPMNIDGTFDLVIADPHHTFDSTTAGVELGLRLLREGGVMLVHDCLPPRELMDPEFQPSEWCGESYAAFRAVCLARELPWFTMHTDFGVGVVIKSHPTDSPLGQTLEVAHTTGLSRAAYELDPYVMMRVVLADDGAAALECLVTNQSLSHLLASFEGWDEPTSPRLADTFPPPLDPGVAFTLLAQQAAALRQERDQLRSRLRELESSAEH